jgi:hypothetical protein
MPIAIAAALACEEPLMSQAPGVPSHPTFSGTWSPSDPVQSDGLFNLGLTLIPGQGRLTIEQRVNRLTVMFVIPDDELDRLLGVVGRLNTTTVYRISETPGRVGGAGAGGSPSLSQPTWFGEQLVVPNMRPSNTPITTTISLDGDRLKLQTRGGRNVVDEWFTKAKSQ